MSDLAERLGRALGDRVEVSGRPIDLLKHAHDASHYLLHPRAVVRPADTGQVAEVMRACARLGVPLTFRGGGTSLSGQAVTDAVLVDTRTAFTGVEVLDEGRRVRVEPGVTVRRVNAHLAPYRRRLGPDPASELACTMGGVIADNSSGMLCGTEQNAYRTLESMVLVLASGTLLDSADPAAPALLREREPALHAGLLALRDQVRGDAAGVATLRRLFAIKNTMGYGLNAFLDHDEPLDILVRLMVGSEGTLGFVASAVFRTVEVLPHMATGLLVLDGLRAASDAVPAVSAAGMVTAELLDAAALAVAAADPARPAQVARLDLGSGPAALLVELQAGSGEELAERRAEAQTALAGLNLVAAADLTADPAERAALWRTRKGIYSAVAGARPAGTSALLEDVAVPTPALGELATGLVDLFAAHAYEGSVIFGHARDGNLHFLLNERVGDPASVRRYEAFTLDMVDLVLGLGGTLKAEHGTGRIMAPFVERQYGPALTEVMRELKRLADPGGLLNPDVVLSADPQVWLRHLKSAPAVEREVDRCVECGFCEPVCPSRTLTMTPRQRIVVRRERQAALDRGDLATVAALEADYDYDGVQTCAADGMCGTVCPVHIDTGDLVRRLRAEGSSPAAEKAWIAAAGSWGPATRAGSTALRVASRVSETLGPRLPVAASDLARRVAGTDLVPRYDPALGPGGGPRPVLEDPDPQVVLFASCVGTLFGGGAGAALVDLCSRAGVGLRTPAGLDGLCCGTPWKSKGHRAGWARMAARDRIALTEASDGGRLPVLVEASSCAEGLALAVEGAGLRVLDALDFVADVVAPRLSVTGRLPAVVVHPTCSSTALGSTDALLRLAGLVAERVHTPVAWGCCAFAGDRGLLHPELTAAATAAEAAEVLAVGRPEEPVAYVSGNRTCELGMTRATGRPYRHVLEVLAEVAER